MEACPCDEKMRADESRDSLEDAPRQVIFRIYAVPPYKTFEPEPAEDPLCDSWREAVFTLRCHPCNLSFDLVR